MKKIGRLNAYETLKEGLGTEDIIHHIKTSINIDTCNNYINKKSKGVDC